MSKIFIEFEKDKNNNYKNIILREKSLLVNRKYNINNTNGLIDDINSGKVSIKKKKNKYLIDDKNIIKKYSKVAKNIDKKNRIIKRTKFVSLAVIGTLGSYIILNNKKKDPINIPSTTEESTEDNNKATEDTTTDFTEENQSSEISTEESKIEGNNRINEPETYTFEAEDWSQYNDVVERFDIEEPINYYSECYGISPELMIASICQENMSGEINNTDKGAYGLTQIESLRQGETIYAYNFLTKSYDEETIDLERVKYDNSYAIKVSYMIKRSDYDYFTDEYEYLNNLERILITMYCYNKGIGTVSDALDDNDTFEETVNQIKADDSGDDDYIKNVFRYLKNGTEIYFRNHDDTYSSIIINNVNANTLPTYK